VPPLGGRPRRLDGVPGESGQVDLPEVEGEFPRLDLGEEEEIAHKANQAFGVSLDDPGELALLLAQLARGRILHEFEVADDRGQGCSQLVRDEGDELVLQAVELA